MQGLEKSRANDRVTYAGARPLGPAGYSVESNKFNRANDYEETIVAYVDGDMV